MEYMYIGRNRVFHEEGIIIGRSKYIYCELSSPTDDCVLTSKNVHISSIFLCVRF